MGRGSAVDLVQGRCGGLMRRHTRPAEARVRFRRNCPMEIVRPPRRVFPSAELHLDHIVVSCGLKVRVRAIRVGSPATGVRVSRGVGKREDLGSMGMGTHDEGGLIPEPLED